MHTEQIDNIEKSILDRTSRWVFDEQVALIFDAHVRRSIPCYDEIQELISLISVDYLGDGSVVYDLGTSTGEIIYRIDQENKGKRIRYFGIDNSPFMLKMAMLKCKLVKDTVFLCQNLEDFNFKVPSDLTISAFTLQFLNPSQRIGVLYRIKESLSETGIFILFEKTISEDKITDTKFNKLHERWKSQYFTGKEIRNKRKSLADVMKPQTFLQIIIEMEQAGFYHIYPVFQWCNFTGFIAY